MYRLEGLSAESGLLAEPQRGPVFFSRGNTRRLRLGDFTRDYQVVIAYLVALAGSTCTLCHKSKRNTKQHVWPHVYNVFSLADTMQQAPLKLV